MNLEEALRDLATALEATGAARGRDARLRAARQVVVGQCVAALAMQPTELPSVASVIRLATQAPARPARRSCAVLLIHALAVPGLVPAACAGDMRALAEGALRDVLLRCGYPFSGSIEQRMRVLERLHATIGELMQPLEPTFPNWQGLYAG
jgi:hypothetical protein